VAPQLRCARQSLLFRFSSQRAVGAARALRLRRRAKPQPARRARPRLHAHRHHSADSALSPLSRHQSGKAVKLSSFRAQSLGPIQTAKGKSVVLFFYPADGTPGCTKEACAFRDAYSEFTAAGAAVFGVSGDSAESHAAFKAAQSLPFPLLVDEGDAVRAAYGIAPDFFGALKGRQTFVIGTDGVVALSFNNQFNPEEHVKKTLAVL
jgi:peroxiredoxin Q/BCP